MAGKKGKYPVSQSEAGATQPLDLQSRGACAGGGTGTSEAQDLLHLAFEPKCIIQ